MARDLRIPTEDEYRSHGAPPFRNVRATDFEPVALDEEAHTLEIYASTGEWARDGMRIAPEAWRAGLPTYLENPIVKWCHLPYEVPIGLTRSAEIDGRGLKTLLWFDAEAADVADIWRGIVTKRVRCASVAWNEPRTEEFGAWVDRPDGSRGFEWQRNIVPLEISMVPIPVDTGANAMLRTLLGIPELPADEALARNEAEETRVLEYLGRLNGAAEWLRNWSRHIAKAGGAPSPAVIEQALSPLSHLIEIATGRGGGLREGKVLSAANKAKVKAALEALQELYAGAGGEEGEEGRSGFEVPGSGLTPNAERRTPNPPTATLEELVANIREERAAEALRELGVTP
jgi:hypothetical protein